MQFKQLIDLIVLLDKLGFQDIEIAPEVLPDELQVKHKKLIAGGRVLVSYLND